MKKKFFHFYFGLFLTVKASATTLFFGPSLYFSERDSPFYGGIVDNTGEGVYLENFEDGELNTPYVFEPGNVPFIGSTVRSRITNPVQGRIKGVDGDDGLIDGKTFAGDSWSTIDRRTFGVSGRMEFEFLPNENGDLPLFVGIVITETLNVDVDVEVSWRDTQGRTLFDDGEFDPKSWSPPGGTGVGSPLIQRFVGLYHSDGIERIQLDNVAQVDHLQYGYSIPEPSISGLLALTMGGFLLRRKRSS